ncbi:MAG: methionine--tRNA ligase [Candidatus Babeliaceae bacterium]
MKSDSPKFYVTTPIYYPNARPHVGSLYSTVLADVAARWHALLGDKVFLLTGTDEHGQKIAQAALAAGKEPQQFVNEIAENFKDVWRAYYINYNYFIRTTDEHHKHAVQEWLKKLIAQGDIYKSFYSGWYCTSCETFVTEKDAAGIENPACASCGRQTQFISEESYFFKLSAYQDKLLQFYQDHPEFIVPQERAHEVINFVKSGLNDLSISRTTVSWGIPFPGDEHHVTYVWADALNNYITGVGYGDKHRTEEFNFWWPADLHVMGKDIIRFHAIYWPAFLMASGLQLPKQLLVHGWIKIGDQKMSKSLGNVIDPMDLYHTYGADAVRYYLVRHLAINQDSPMSIPDLEQRINADLAHDLGNLLNRMLILAKKYDITTLSAPEYWEPAEVTLRDEQWSMIVDVTEEMEEYYFHRAYARVWKFIHQVNAYFHGQAPWKVAVQDKEALKRILSATAHSLYATAILIEPVMPVAMKNLIAALGGPAASSLDELSQEPWHRTFTLQQCEPLFKQYEQKEKEEEVPTVIDNSIGIEDFAKVELLVGIIEHVEEIPGSEKLYKLLVNFGDRGVRQICSGVRAHFKPEDLRNKQGVFWVNAKPRKMMGVESQGMMLFAENAQGKLEMLTVGAPVTQGSKVR